MSTSFLVPRYGPFKQLIDPIENKYFKKNVLAISIEKNEESYNFFRDQKG